MLGHRHAGVLPGVRLGVGRRGRPRGRVVRAARDTDRRRRRGCGRAPGPACRRPARGRPCSGSRRCCPAAISSMCQISRPSPGRSASKPVFCRFSTQEVLLAGGRRPSTGGWTLWLVLTSGMVTRAVRRHVGHRRPALVRLAPGRRVRGDVAAAVPRAARHQAPVADAFGGVVGVVQVGEAEQQVAQLVRADADLGVLGDRQVGEDLGRVGVVDATAGSTCATRCRRCCRSPRRRAPACTTMNASTKPLPSLSYGAKLTVGSAATAASRASWGAAARAAGRADAEVVVGVPGQGLGHPERTDDVADDVDQAVGDLGVVLLHAAVGQDAGREEEVLEVAGGGRHRVVGEPDQHDDDPDAAAQWRTVWRRRGRSPSGVPSGNSSGGMITPSSKPR